MFSLHMLPPPCRKHHRFILFSSPGHENLWRIYMTRWTSPPAGLTVQLFSSIILTMLEKAKHSWSTLYSPQTWCRSLSFCPLPSSPRSSHTAANYFTTTEWVREGERSIHYSNVQPSRILLNLDVNAVDDKDEEISMQNEDDVTLYL